ncbi:TRAP transporter substrate-binding protein [Halarsenatibacter silvermanii]|uniref:Extracellular solute-binding protein, family 7 n=1 Tax=Halarsenatibacter silvermanii TaxID=321763 RepID=A0A1G9SEM9_9FIRM|nr:TRAP transporter substrate-binding protein [Halarsenatibacter silvermanii]SDM33842.1 extracellular solute-binding protein, family 7 [Halarsenatibacter silvermanii]
MIDRRLFVLAFTLIVGLSLTFSAAAEAGETMRIAHYFAADHPTNERLEGIFKETVEENTDHTVEVYPANQLGSEEEFSEGVMMGEVEMAVTGNMWEMFDESISFIQLPYVFVNMEHAYDTMTGELGDQVYEELFEPLGIEVMGYFSQGGRALSNNVRPIEHPDDTEGITMRTWEGTTIIEIMESFGFDVTVMSMDELFTALQQGVVDAQDNPISATYHQGWFEVLDYVSTTEHIIAPNYFVSNQEFMNNLPDEDQQLIKETAAETTAKIHEDIMEEEEEIIETVKEDYDVEFTDPDVEPFMETTEHMIEEFIEDFPETEDLIRDIQEAGEEYID